MVGIEQVVQLFHFMEVGFDLSPDAADYGQHYIMSENVGSTQQIEQQL